MNIPSLLLVNIYLRYFSYECVLVHIYIYIDFGKPKTNETCFKEWRLLAFENERKELEATALRLTQSLIIITH